MVGCCGDQSVSARLVVDGCVLNTLRHRQGPALLLMLRCTDKFIEYIAAVDKQS